MSEKLKGLGIIAWISILAIVLASAGISGVTATSGDKDFVPNEAIVGFHESVTTQDQNGTIQQHGGKIIKRNKVLNSVLVSVEDEQTFITEISKEQSVKYAERNGIAYAISPSDVGPIEPPEDSDFMQQTPNDQAKQRGPPSADPPDPDTIEPPEDSEYIQSTPNDRAKHRGPASTSPPEVEEIELPENIESIQYTPNDPLWSSQWGPQSIKCPQAWDKETGSTSVVSTL